MENFTLNKDIHLICVRATSFPDGIQEAMEKLEQVDSSIATRTFYGVSHGSDNGIIYWAAVQEAFSGEANTFKLESYKLKKGVYASETLNNIMDNEEKIGQTFEKLLEHPHLDPMGECIEWYKSINEVQCMVRILE